MKKIIGVLFIAFSIITLAAGVAHSQIVPIDLGPGDGDGHTTPIGGLAVLATLGGGYAIKRLRDKKQ